MQTRTRKYERPAKVKQQKPRATVSHRTRRVKTTEKLSTKIKLLYTTQKKAVKTTRKPPKPIKNRELMYEVEDVVDARMGPFGPEFKVKWEGYPSSQSSWIDELPSFFKSKCLSLIKNVTKVVDDSSDSEMIYETSDSESGSESDSESASESDSDSSECESEGGPAKRQCYRCYFAR